jgi:hypothetical protein
MRVRGFEWKGDTEPTDTLRPGWHTGWAAELFYLLEGGDYGGLRLSVGYSFSNIPDPLMFSDLRGFDSPSGLFVRLEGML